MVEVKEPEIKLFGMKILLPENGKKKAVVIAAGESSDEIDDENCGGPNSGLCLDDSKVSRVEQEEEDADKEQQQIEEDGLVQHCSSSDDPKTPPIDEDIASTDPPKTHNDQTDETNSQHKTLKKPDKILPCPRCKSMDTKFCYYNNYNVNQPRHFCRSCQRYWTAGGNMRNVPVGAGRRRNKNSTSHCHHITISDALKVETLNGFHHKHNGTVLSFDNCPSGSSVNTKSTVEEGKSGPVEPPMQNMNGFSYIPWTVPWGVTVPFPAVCPTGFLYPMPYWFPPFPTQRTSCPTFPDSHLGKRSRDGGVLRPDKPESRECAGERNLESSIVVPKTLRIDNPDEAAKSPIWATLGIKYDSAKREGLFKAFQSGGDKKKPMMSTSAIMHANPAALSRSLGFQENA